MANPDIGTIPCAHCSATAAVRKNRNSGLYYSCPNCGLITPRLRAGQEYILTHAAMFGPDGAPESPAPAAPETAPAPPASPDIPRGQGGRFKFFETIL